MAFMASKNYFGNYSLSQTTLDKLNQVNDILQCDKHNDNLAWALLNPKQEIEELQSEDEKSIHDDDDDDVAAKDVEDNQPESSTALSSTPFFFTQRDEKSSTNQTSIDERGSKSFDIAESLCESLERDRTDVVLGHLETMRDTDVNEFIQYLSTQLSLKGTYNLCHAICAINHQSMSYIRVICSILLLPKIIELQEPSRLMTAIVDELTKKFPEDILDFIYIPILKATHLKDTSIMSAIINSCDTERKKYDLITMFLTTIHELKEWHVDILSQLINVKIPEDGMKNRLLDILFEKASVYSGNKNYSKFIISFIKLNSPFTEDEKNLLGQLVAENKTMFRNVMNNLIEKMYVHNKLWYIP